MKQENRRSFVKKSIATSVSISFAGLIRAHGEEGGTTTTNTTVVETTWDPNQTTVATTYGEATTWDPNQTTIDTTVLDSTWDPNQTTIPETTTPPNHSYVTKGTVTGDETPTEDTSTTTYAIVYHNSSVVFKAKLQWHFSMKNTIGAEAQPSLVEMDCLSCKVHEVNLELKSTLIEGSQSKFDQFSMPGANAGPVVHRGIRVASSVSQQTSGNNIVDVAKLSSSGPFGEPNVVTNGIKIDLAAKVTPAGDSGTKTVEWTVTPDVSAIPVASIKNQLTDALKAIFGAGENDHNTFSVEVPPPVASSNVLTQTATANLTEEEVFAGAGCSM